MAPARALAARAGTGRDGAVRVAAALPAAARAVPGRDVVVVAREVVVRDAAVPPAVLRAVERAPAPAAAVLSPGAEDDTPDFPVVPAACPGPERVARAARGVAPPERALPRAVPAPEPVLARPETARDAPAAVPSAREAAFARPGTASPVPDSAFPAPAETPSRRLGEALPGESGACASAPVRVPSPWAVPLGAVSEPAVSPGAPGADRSSRVPGSGAPPVWAGGVVAGAVTDEVVPELLARAPTAPAPFLDVLVSDELVAMGPFPPSRAVQQRTHHRSLSPSVYHS
ncbi:hypothetical protein CC117_18745 [Parafrankia colletiae]|uniref:Uncharacterized protein n=1 Tax=Parafrankia colletiae TaxID=573497 RepID=A0A1S1QUX5_9ACTN|nr:hypothetical protein [Parafrankia colletiae]MCK9901033.1 hypothetical protein [Frankia sp. Cpl3]OHV36214.1 hypothetical protein CC117_18745 [Parafrankia colletiae]